MTEAYQKCPLCGQVSQTPFLAGSIDKARLTGFSYASRKEPEFMNFPYVACPDCDLVYTTTPPADADLKQAYGEADYDSSEEALFAARTYRRIFRPWIQKMARKGCAIDVGAGNGALLPLLRAEGFAQTFGIEPSTKAILSAPEDVRPFLRAGFFSQALIDDLSPDFICTSMTMEHVRQPLDLMSAFFEKLAPGGLVAVVVHNRRGWLNRLLGKRSPIIDIEHLQLFSPRSLETLFVKAGFTPLFIGNYANTYPLRYWVRLMPLPSPVKRGIVKFLDRFGASLWPLTLPVGNMLGIGRK